MIVGHCPLEPIEFITDLGVDLPRKRDGDIDPTNPVDYLVNAPTIWPSTIRDSRMATTRASASAAQ